jgi:hypothetical protein
VTLVFCRVAFFRSSHVNSVTKCPYTDVVSSWGDGGCGQEEERRVFGPGWVRERQVVVINGWCCCAKHSERTHVKLRDEASPRRWGGGDVADSIKSTYTASLESWLSGDTLECLSWSRKLSNGERGVVSMGDCYMLHLHLCSLLYKGLLGGRGFYRVTQYVPLKNIFLWYGDVGGRDFYRVTQYVPLQIFVSDMETSTLWVKGCKIYAYTRRSVPLSKKGSWSCKMLGAQGGMIFIVSHMLYTNHIKYELLQEEFWM